MREQERVQGSRSMEREQESMEQQRESRAGERAGESRRKEHGRARREHKAAGKQESREQGGRKKNVQTTFGSGALMSMMPDEALLTSLIRWIFLISRNPTWRPCATVGPQFSSLDRCDRSPLEYALSNASPKVRSLRFLSH